MKEVMTIVLAGVSTLAFAQRKVDLSRSIDDDGKQLSISVHGTVDGKRIDYDRIFQVAGLGKEERNEIADRVLDSLGLEKIKAPSPPCPPQAPYGFSAPQPPVHFSADHSGSDAAVVAWEDGGDQKERTVESQKPYAKEVRYDSVSGELYLRYQFMKNGEEFIYEKTVKAGEKSGKQRENVIRDFEKEIALPGDSIQ